ncbi:MAG: 2-oxoglutarate dehydrogenase complex dihydrolipoyllysine-residue succinyltransferase [Deltaproteobacteria bacterium]|nr:MAG: 2-oxoglutarate dehydrogenase complex dihydrolipoyllysine-residue succinyltransferase [Deltaproteobacteria bacterium]
MLIEIKVPSVGESVTEAVLVQWFKQDGDVVRKGEALYVIETDKITLEVEAEADGVLNIKAVEGENVAIGAVVGTIDTEGMPRKTDLPKEPPAQEEPAALPLTETGEPTGPLETEPVSPLPAAPPGQIPSEPFELPGGRIFSPSVRRLLAEKGIDASQIAATGPGGRITKGDVLLYLEQTAVGIAQKLPTMPAALEAVAPQRVEVVEEKITRKAMSPIRQRIAVRLLEAKQNTAMLTTFNEIDMSRVIDIRAQYKEAFKKKHNVSLGFMSFFIKASVAALKEFPEINAFIEDKEIVYHHYQHIGVAVGSERGLVVPVIRHAEKLSFAQLEKAIIDFVAKINENRLDLADLEGGTFTISNGGVYGSLLSTPILNMPQSAILGMHKIEKRPVVVDDQMVIRPMMYVALSYDHRIVDGREAVTFLKRIKEFAENPERMIVEI